MDQLISQIQNSKYFERIPNNWEIKSYNQIMQDISSGNTKIQKSSYLESGQLPVVDQGKDIIAGYNDDLNNKVRIGAPYIVFGDHTRIFKYVDFPFAMGADGLKVLKVIDKNIYPKYIYYYLRTIRIPDTGYNRHYKFLKNLIFPLPPSETQKKIAEILDKADALRQQEKKIIEKYDHLTQSVFLDMFGDINDNKNKFPLTTIQDITTDIKDGPHVSPDYVIDGIPILSTRNIRPGQLIMSEVKYVSKSNYSELTKRFKPSKNDVLLTKGGTTGYAKVVDFDWPFCVWVHVAVLRPILSFINPKYLETAMNSYHCYVQSQKYTHGIANKDLGLTRIAKIKLLKPPIELQSRFAEIVEKIEKQKQLTQKSLEKSEQLFQSLLQRAFEGELV